MILNGLHLNTATLEKYKLKTQPFQSEACYTEDFLLTDSLKMIQHGIHKSLSGDIDMCLIKGEKGIGKTSFAHHIHKNDKPYTSFLYTAKKKNNLTGIFKCLSKNSVQSNDINELAKSATITIFELLKSGEQPLLIIDDAELVRPDTLKIISRLTKSINDQKLGHLKFVLIGERNIDNAQNTLKVPTYSVQMRAFNKNEIQRYIEQKFVQANSELLPTISEKSLNKITIKSGGIPSHINHQAVLHFNRKPTSVIASQITIPVLIVALLASLFFVAKDSAKKHVEDQLENNIAAETTKVTTIEPIPSPEVAPVNSETGTNIDTDAGADTIAEPIIGNTLHSHEWLLAQNNEHYVLQLFGTEQYDKLAHFVETIITRCDLAYYLTTRNDRPWHVLLCGTYPDSVKAKNAIDELPVEIKNNKPWPRSLKDIQAAIIKNN